MLFAVGLLIVSAVLLMLYSQADCERILRREFDHEFFRAVVNASGLGFPSVRKALEECDVTVEYPRLRMRLYCDFLALTYLLKNACNLSLGFSYEERLLKMYFYANWVALSVPLRLSLIERAAALKLTSILEYFANVLGERQAWKMESDIMVEDSGTVFLVYPLSDAAREWLEMNPFKNSRRLGDIQFIEPRRLCASVEAMLNSNLWVVWSSGFSIVGNTGRKTRERAKLPGSWQP
jgi:hypothetical protein